MVSTAAPVAAPTPARAEPVTITPEAAERGRLLLTALGGAGNVREVSAAALTRVRAVVADVAKVDQTALESAGIGLMQVRPDTLHLLVGVGQAEPTAAAMKG